MIHVISASFGGYDEAHTPPEHADMAWTMVSDWCEPWYESGWNVAPVQIPHLHPRMAAKIPKCRPCDFDPYSSDTIVWLDASARVKDVDKFHAAIISVPDFEPMAQFAHPDRQCIYDEVEASRPMEKYKGQDFDRQIVVYRHFGMPKKYGLWATGMIVYHPRTFDLDMFGNEWLHQQSLFTYQDQISQPFLFWQNHTRPYSLPQGLRANDYVSWFPHTRDN